MIINGGAPKDILEQLSKQDRELSAALFEARLHVKQGKQEVYPYQAAALYLLAKPYNGKAILELGTYYGYTAYVLSKACPDSKIITVNPTPWEVAEARHYLTGRNVEVKEMKSWDYLAESKENFNFIFVDGDHKRINQDIPWFDRLNEGGAMIFHDWTPEGAPRHCPPVFEAVNEMAKTLGRDLDIKIVDQDLVGMAGGFKNNRASSIKTIC